MSQQLLLTAIGEHLDLVATYVDWLIVFAIAISWAGIRRETEIEALGVKFNRRHAFFAVATLYLVANVAILILLLRIGDLLLLIDDRYVVRGVTRLATASWVLNPFSYFGASPLSRLHSGEGFGLLIATWWLCNTSLSTLMDDKRNRGAQVLLALFLVLGLASILAIQRSYAVILERLAAVDSPLLLEVKATWGERMVAAILGIAVGGLIFTAANVVQERWLRNASRPNV